MDQNRAAVIQQEKADATPLMMLHLKLGEGQGGRTGQRLILHRSVGELFDFFDGCQTFFHQMIHLGGGDDLTVAGFQVELKPGFDTLNGEHSHYYPFLSVFFGYFT